MSQSDMPTALDLPMVDPLPEATQKYFDICKDKLGMVPNVLKAHAFDVSSLTHSRGFIMTSCLARAGCPSSNAR